MSTRSNRRSGRIAKEIPIVLLGTDTTGKVFSEETKTVVLSRHGAGLISRYRFAPDEVLTLRMPGSNKEAEIRLVGQIGGEPGRYVYGVAFVDSDLHFWPMEFPPPEVFESEVSSVVLACSLCSARQTVEQHEIEDDVYCVNGYILRFCDECSTSTPWKKSDGKAIPATSTIPPKSPPRIGQLAENIASLGGPTRPLTISVPSNLLPNAPSQGASVFEFSPAAARHFAHESDQPSAYSGASELSEFASFSEVHSSHAQVTPVAVLQAPAQETKTKNGNSKIRAIDSKGKPVNRRKHMRIRVNFSACLRLANGDEEVVECENVSKGGLCFHSVRKYSQDSLLDIAAPYSPGEPALFVPAQIRRVESLPGTEVFRYGIEYLKAPS